MRYILVIFLVVFSSCSQAAGWAATGKVVHISLQANDVDAVNFYVDGFTEAGSCFTNKTAYGDLVILGLTNTEETDRQFALVLAAKMAGKEIRVVVVEAETMGWGYCVAKIVEMSD